MKNTGAVFLVGIGPGDRDMMTPRAGEVLKACTAIVGYTGYVGMVKDLIPGKECHALPLGQEMERARLALDLASSGHRVGVISSGDPGIYGMAAVVLEILEGISQTQRPEVVVLPGLSAVNAAAALLGAPLGHDFAVISLSDLLTPWEVIEKRLAAAAEGDFVLAILNPKSKQRNWQLDRARAILLAKRNPETPLGLVRHAYRPEQAVAVTTLAELDPNRVDMFTTVIVGNSHTRSFQGKLVTPRGYVCQGAVEGLKGKR